MDATGTVFTVEWLQLVMPLLYQENHFHTRYSWPSDTLMILVSRGFRIVIRVPVIMVAEVLNRDNTWNIKARKNYI